MKKLLIILLTLLSISATAQVDTVHIRFNKVDLSGYTTKAKTTSDSTSFANSLNGKSAYVASITALENYTGNSNTVIVQDSLRGGTFNYTPSATPDSMTVFTRYGGGYWKRQFQKGTYNILWAGVDNKGVSDNTGILNYVFSTLPGGSTILFPGGTYKATSLKLTRAINIKGTGLSSTITCTSADSVLLSINASYINVKNLNLNGNGLASYGTTATNGNLINIAGTHIILDNLSLSGSAKYGIFSDSLGNVNNILINNCTISNIALSGIHVVGRNGSNQVNVVHVNNCTIVFTGGNSLEMLGQSLTIENNTFENSLKRGVVISSDLLKGVAGGGAYGVNIKHNYFETCDSGFVLIKATTGVVATNAVSIEGNFGSYNTTGVNAVNKSGINICEIQDPAFTSPSANSINGFRYINNRFEGDTINSIFNGNNVLGISAVIQPISNISLASYINLGASVVLQGGYYMDKTTNQTFDGYKTFSKQLQVTDAFGTSIMGGAQITGSRSSFSMGNTYVGGGMSLRGDALYFRNGANSVTYGIWNSYDLEIYNQLKIDSISNASSASNILVQPAGQTVKYRTPTQLKADIAITYPDIPAGAIANNTTVTTQPLSDSTDKAASTAFVKRAVKADSTIIFTARGIKADTTLHPGYTTLVLDSAYIRDSVMAGSTSPTEGTYTPTITGIANYASGTAYVCRYMRTGNTVTVYGKVTVQPTATATITTFSLSLPVTSTFSDSYDAAGTGGGIFSGTYYPYVISSASAGSVLNVSFISNQTSGEQDCQFTATYKVL